MSNLFYNYISTSLTSFSQIRKHQWGVFINETHHTKYAPEKKSGLLGASAVAIDYTINTMIPERPKEGGLLKDMSQRLHYYDYLLERTRTLFRIELYNIPRLQGLEDVLSVSYAESFHTGVLEFLIRGPKPIVGDLSDIIDREEMTVEEYIDQGYYQRSMDRINQSVLMTEEEAQEIINRWYPQTTGKDLIEMISYLYLVRPPKIQDQIANDIKHLWYYLLSFGLWYKEHLTIATLYEDLAFDELDEFEDFLRGEDHKESQVRDKIYSTLDCTDEEDFSKKLSRIQAFYQRVVENLEKKGKVKP